MLTTKHRRQLEKTVQDSSGKTQCAESYIISRDLMEIDGKQQYVMLFVDLTGRGDVDDLNAEMVKPISIEKEWLDKRIEECDKLRENNAFKGVSFLTTVEDVQEEGNEEDAMHDLIMNHYGPWDFLKLFFISLFK